MKVNLLYLCLIITVCFIDLGYTQSLVDILNNKDTEDYLEKSINDFFGSLNDALFPEDDEVFPVNNPVVPESNPVIPERNPVIPESNPVIPESNAVSNEALSTRDRNNRKVQPRPSTVDNSYSRVDKIWKEDEDEGEKQEPQQQPKPQPTTQTNPPPNTANLDFDDDEDESANNLIPSVKSETPKPTTEAPKPTTTTVVRTTTVVTSNKPKATQTPSSPPTSQPPSQPTQNNPASSDPKTYPPPVIKENEDEVTNGLLGNNNNNNNNNNNSVPSSYPKPSSENSNNNSPSNQNESLGQNNNIDNSNPQEDINQNEQISSQESQVPVTDDGTVPATPATENSLPNIEANTVPVKNENIDNVKANDKQNNNKSDKKKGGILSTIIKIGVGLTVGGLCFAGLIVGRNKFKNNSDDSYENIYSCNSIPATISTNTLNKSNSNNSMAMAMGPKEDNYSNNIPSNYLKPNIPMDSFPTNQEFINTNSIEPLPNLVNKVDVELPVYNIKEENYNTVGRPLQEDEIDDKTKLLNEGYNNIVPEMGEMVIEHTNCPSFTSSMFEALDELEDQNDENEDGNKMKQIIPDIRYATVEVNSEFENISMDEDVNHDGMKQIIPDIQYATVEMNNEFAGIDDDDDNYSRTNSRVVVDIDANRSITTRSSDVEELRTSEFLAISDSMDSFKSISETYRNALRGTYDGGNRDTLTSTDSILHKLH